MPSSPNKRNRSWNPKRKQHHRLIDNSKFYNSWTWRKKRKQILNNNPLCVMCEREDIITNATVVDHILAISAGGCKLCEDNLQSLCSYHHNQKSGKEAHGFIQK
ncbi:MAG TPA: HNH endonuclease [Lutibacter sp.]|nr:HNH endonuclease [Lutibacter sp.]